MDGSFFPDQPTSRYGQRVKITVPCCKTVKSRGYRYCLSPYFVFAEGLRIACPHCGQLYIVSNVRDGSCDLYIEDKPA